LTNSWFFVKKRWFYRVIIISLEHELVLCASALAEFNLLAIREAGVINLLFLSHSRDGRIEGWRESAQGAEQ
jgi:hypothetical protein